MFGVLTKKGYTMSSLSLDKEIDDFLSSFNNNDRNFTKLYMDTHYVRSLNELKDILKEYGKQGFARTRYKCNVLLSAIKFVETYGTMGAVGDTGYDSQRSIEELQKLNVKSSIVDFQDIDEFIDYAVRLYLHIEPTKEKELFVDELLQRIELTV